MTFPSILVTLRQRDVFSKVLIEQHQPNSGISSLPYCTGQGTKVQNQSSIRNTLYFSFQHVPLTPEHFFKDIVDAPERRIFQICEFERSQGTYLPYQDLYLNAVLVFSMFLEYVVRKNLLEEGDKVPLQREKQRMTSGTPVCPSSTHHLNNMPEK